VVHVTHGFPHPGQFGGHAPTLARQAALIAVRSRPITGAMFWTSPHARLLLLVAASAVALAVLAISPERRTSREPQVSAPTASWQRTTAGSRAHERVLYRVGLTSTAPAVSARF
jgi:hypothetical protein